MPQNIFDKLIEEHNEFKDMLSELESGENQETFQEFRKELLAHNEGEEQTLYKALMTDKKGREMALVGTEEHRLGTTVVHKLDKATGENWNVQINLLKHLLEKHIEVEEKEVIPMAKRMLKQEQVNQISEEFESIEEKLEQ